MISLLKREFSSRDVSILGLKANGFLIRIYSLAINLSCSCSSTLLQQLHAHADPQYLLLAKHSQYSFKHLDLLQLQGLWAVRIGGTSEDEISGLVSTPSYFWEKSAYFLKPNGNKGLFSDSILLSIFLASIALLKEDTCLLLML